MADETSSNKFSPFVPIKDYRAVKDALFATKHKLDCQRIHSETLEKKFNKLSSDYADSKERNRELEKEVRRRTKEVGELRDKYSDSIVVDEENQQLKLQNKNLDSSLTSIQKRYKKRIKELEKKHEQELKEKDKEIAEIEKRHQKEKKAIERKHQKELKEKDEEIAKLNTRIEELIVSKKKDFTTSSSPSSSKPFHKNIINNREKTGRKPGGQPGHEGHGRRAPVDPNPPIKIEVPKEITENTENVATGNVKTRVVVGLEVKPIVKTFESEEYINVKTGKKFYPNFPPNVMNDINYDESIKAFIFLLTNYAKVSIKKVAEIIAFLTDGMVTPSTGFIASLNKEFSSKSKEERDEIVKNLFSSSCLYTDNTSARVNGKGRNVSVIANNEGDVMYSFGEHKGHESIKGTPIEFFDGTLVHDHDVSFYSYGKTHQECLSHILRYVKSVVEFDKERKWAPKMHELLQKMIFTRNREPELDGKTIEAFVKDYMEIVEEGMNDYEKNPPGSQYSREGYLLCKRLKEYQDDTLYFLDHPEVETTNNRSERLLRFLKTKERQMVTGRSDQAGVFLCDCLGVIQTIRQKDKPLLYEIERIFAKPKPLKEDPKSSEPTS